MNRDEIITADNENQRFFDDNFQAFNFPYENKGSFTVKIEDALADTWQECITQLINSHGTQFDRFWKVEYGVERKIDKTIHIYNNPKNRKASKLMLQGSTQSLICSYVFSELPKIYKLVCEAQPKPLEGNMKKKPTVKCDQCHFKSNMIKMKLHIKNMHIKKATRASKRLPDFTPVVKPSKRTKAGPSSHG